MCSAQNFHAILPLQISNGTAQNNTPYTQYDWKSADDDAKAKPKAEYIMITMETTVLFPCLKLPPTSYHSIHIQSPSWDE